VVVARPQREGVAGGIGVVSRVAPFILLAGLLAFTGLHAAIVVELVRRREFIRAAVALFIPALAPWWAWERGMRRRSGAWLGALAIYAVGVVIG
jgi:hypothetical protein